MPRKTRKQKERASQRHAQSTNSDLVKREFEFNFTDNNFSKIKQSVAKKHEKSILLVNTSFVTQDLIKTLIIALGMFGLEVVLYLAWFKN